MSSLFCSTSSSDFLLYTHKSQWQLELLQTYRIFCRKYRFSTTYTHKHVCYSGFTQQENNCHSSPTYLTQKSKKIPSNAFVSKQKLYAADFSIERSKIKWKKTHIHFNRIWWCNNNEPHETHCIWKRMTYESKTEMNKISFTPIKIYSKLFAQSFECH